MANCSAKWTDQQMLEILDKRERVGLTGAKIAEALGVSRSAILGLLFRLNRDTDLAEQGSIVTKPENRDGGMPVRWWARRSR